MNKYWKNEIGFNTATGDPAGGVAVIPDAGASAAPQPGAGAPPSASPAATSGGPGAAPRMYSSEEVSRTVQERLAREQEKYAPWKEFGDHKQVKERLSRLDNIEKALANQGKDPQSAEERELRDLISKLGFTDSGSVQKLEERLAGMERMGQQQHIDAGRGQIASLAKEKFGDLNEHALALVEQAVTAAIGGNKESLGAFFGSGREKVVSEAFAQVFEKQFDPFLKSAAARYSAGKATDKTQVPPPTPKGGVQAPVTQERKLSGEERREQAWNRMQELEGKG